MTKGKNVRNLTLSLLFVTALTLALPWWYGLFTSIPLRIAAILFVQVLIAGIAVIMNSVVEKEPFTALGFRKENLGKQVMFGFLFFAILAALFIGAPLLFGLRLQDLLPGKDSLIAFSLIYKIIFVGFSEEILFRGYILSRLQKLMNANFGALVLSSVLFGAWHFLASSNILQVLFTAVIGFILGFGTIRFKNYTTLSAAIAHGLYDGLLAFLSWALL